MSRVELDSLVELMELMSELVELVSRRRRRDQLRTVLGERENAFALITDQIK